MCRKPSIHKVEDVLGRESLVLAMNRIPFRS